MTMLEMLKPLIEPLSRTFSVTVRSDEYCDWLRVVNAGREFDVFFDEGFDNVWDYRIYNDNEEMVFRSIFKREIIAFLMRKWP